MRIGREYQRQMSILNNFREKDITTKIYLQQEALKALPADLRVHAEVIDDTPPPEDRPLPLFDTPPIKNFDVLEYLKDDANETGFGEEGYSSQ